ncbi:MAG: CorA family divalent cation transporter [Alphaproteobacteria bacterium]|nr:CorA family divalent cation transporter [Alphaproteobacteria bacterium]
MATFTSDFGYVFNGRGGVRKISPQDIHKKQSGQTWVHVDYQDEDNQALIEKLSLNKTITAALLDTDTSPRFIAHKKGLLLIMRGINFDKRVAEDMIALRVWLEKGRLITLSHRSIPCIPFIQDALHRGKGPKNPVECLLAIAVCMTQNIALSIHWLHDVTDDLEDALIEEQGYSVRGLYKQVADIRHKILELRRYIAPQENVFKTLAGGTPLFGPDHLPQLTDIDADLHKALEDLDYLRDHASIIQTQLDNKMNVIFTQAMYLMSIVVVIFTPVTFVTGLLGSNIGGIPFSDHPNGFLFIVLILVIVIAFQLWLLKRKKWF